MDVESTRLLAAGIAMSVGSIGSAIGEGMIGAKAMEAMGRNPNVKDDLFTKMIVAMAITESTAIYALVVTLLIIFVA